jgi:hypothetical protein
MPTFTEYDVEYINIRPWNNQNAGPGKMRISILDGNMSVKAKIKKALERQLNSLGVRVESFTKVSSS